MPPSPTPASLKALDIWEKGLTHIPRCFWPWQLPSSSWFLCTWRSVPFMEYLSSFWALTFEQKPSPKVLP